MLCARIRESELLTTFISQNRVENHNRNHEAHHNLRMRNERLIQTEVGMSLPFLGMSILPSKKIKNAHIVLIYN